MHGLQDRESPLLEQGCPEDLGSSRRDAVEPLLIIARGINKPTLHQSVPVFLSRNNCRVKLRNKRGERGKICHLGGMS